MEMDAPGDASGRRGRLRWLLPGLVAAVVVGAGIYFLIPPAPLDWAQRDNWKPEPVHKTDLKGTFGRTWQSLPFHISPEEERVVADSVTVMRLNNSTLNGRSRFADPAVRAELESILRQHPDFFYTHYALGLWHKLHGDPGEAERCFKLAFHRAPVVLVQTYRFPDGRPLANTPVGAIEIECNRVENGSLNPDLHLVFPAQVTDERGRIHFPVYNTVYRVSSIAHPAGYDLIIPSLGWFESGRVGLLPSATVRPKPATLLAKPTTLD